MRIIVFCTANLNLGSGSEVRARLIVEGLTQLSVSICVVSSGIPDDFIKNNITYFPLNSYSYEKTLSEASISFKPDLIFCITEAATDSVYHVAKKMKIPFIIDIHGIGVIEIIELGSGYGSRALRIMNSLRWLSVIPKANAITVANPTLFSYISILNRNTFPIFGMTDITYFNPQGHRIALGKDPSKIQVLYAGNYFKWQGVDLLLDSFKHLSTIDSSFELTLIGSVGKKINSTGNFEKYGIHFQNQVDYAEIANYYRGADILIVPRKFLLSTYFALPQKLVDYMSSGKTIIATDIAPHCWALQVPPSGILCKPSVNGISRAIVKAKDPNLQELLSSNSRRKAIAYFDHIQQCKFLKNIFNEIIGC